MRSEPQMPDTRQYDAGSPGVGKTHLCVGLGIRAVEQGFSVQYFRFDELMTALKIDAGLPPARLKRRK
jgi:DNA replication protein DnaC